MAGGAVECFGPVEQGQELRLNSRKLSDFPAAVRELVANALRAAAFAVQLALVEICAGSAPAIPHLELLVGLKTEYKTNASGEKYAVDVKERGGWLLFSNAWWIVREDAKSIVAECHIAFDGEVSSLRITCKFVFLTCDTCKFACM